MNTSPKRKKLSKREQLLRWCSKKGVVSKVQVIRWGLDNFYLRAEREMRQFCEEGFFVRLSFFDCKEMGLKGNMAYYEKL